MTVEINNKAIDDLLPSKVKAVKPIRTQVLPELFFFFCHPISQTVRHLHFLKRNTLTCHNISSGFFH